MRNLLRDVLRAAVLALVLYGSTATAAATQQWRNVTSSRQIWDEKELNVQIQYAAGRLEIGPGAGKLLYQMDLHYDEERFRPLTEYRREDNTLRLGVQSRDRDRGTRGTRISDEARAQLKLNPDLPSRLRLEFAAGEADVNLGGMAIQDVHVSVGASQARISFDSPNRVEAERVKVEAGAADLTVSGLGNARAARIEVSGGVGSTTLDFGGTWHNDTDVSIDMGVGAVTLRIPRALGVQIDRSSFLTRFDHQGLVRRGSSFYSANWETATQRLTVNISAALGSISIVWID
jgi:hypothetical protein